MAISKKIRFEVFKRDGFQCAYCGKSPPEVLLEIDHIKPKSKKGKDDINNLITACFDCNRGKSNIALNKAPQQLADNLAVLQEKEEQLAEYHRLIRKIEKRLTKQEGQIEAILSDTYKDKVFTDSFKHGSLRGFIEKLPMHDVKEAMYIACGKFPEPNRAIQYFCGICWNKIRAKTGEKEPFSKQILKLWNKRRSYFEKGSGYYSEKDLSWLLEVYCEEDLVFLEDCMNMALKKLSNGPYGGYWKNFVWFAQEDNLEKAKECQVDSP